MSPRSTALALAAARLDSLALRQLFLEARSHSRWQPLPVDDAVLSERYELARMAPTAANRQPMRLLFLKTSETRERLRPALAPANVEKTMTAPIPRHLI
jgi:3-hydroxypropanoate dehydrogenase